METWKQGYLNEDYFLVNSILYFEYVFSILNTFIMEAKYYLLLLKTWKILLYNYSYSICEFN